MEIVAQFSPNLKTEHNLEKLPDEILFTVARETLDYSIPHIPMSKMKDHAGTLRRSSGTGESGVHKTSGGYYIGSFTTYASHVWNMDDLTTNWSTPNTHSKWFAYTLRQYGQTILDNAVKQEWKENM